MKKFYKYRMEVSVIFFLLGMASMSGMLFFPSFAIFYFVAGVLLISVHTVLLFAGEPSEELLQIMLLMTGIAIIT